MNTQILIILSSFGSLLLFGVFMFFSIKKYDKKMKGNRGKKRLKYSNTNSAK